MGERLLNAGILLVVAVVVFAVGWLISIGFYELGLWPLGALTRVLAACFALFWLYWVIRHLVESPADRLRKEMEQIHREQERLDR